MIPNKAILSYEDQIKYSLPPLNFEYLLSHPEEIINVANKFLQDSIFRNRIMGCCNQNPVFKKRFYKMFGRYISNFYTQSQGRSR